MGRIQIIGVSDLITRLYTLIGAHGLSLYLLSLFTLAAVQDLIRPSLLAPHLIVPLPLSPHIHRAGGGAALQDLIRQSQPQCQRPDDGEHIDFSK